MRVTLARANRIEFQERISGLLSRSRWLDDNSAIPYHNVTMNEAASQTSRPQVRVLFGARHLDVPHALPRLVEALVDRIDARVMRTHAVAAPGRYTVILCELLVQRHVQLQMSYILVEMRLLMVPHVGKPSKSGTGRETLTRKRAGLCRSLKLHKR